MMLNRPFAPLPSAAHRARVLAAVMQTPAPARARVRARQVLVWVLAGAAALATLLAVGGVDLGARPPALTWATTFGALATALVASQWLIARGSMVGPSRRRVLGGALMLPPALAVWKLAWSVAHAAAAAPAHGELACCAYGIALALGPFGAAMLTRRDTEPLAPRVTGLGIGVASGLWGGLLLELACPDARPVHVIAGHLGAIAACGLAGLALGPLILSQPRGSERLSAGSAARGARPPHRPGPG